MDAPRLHFRERVGTTLAEKYSLRRLLGVGGMAAVYEAENSWTGRRVAIKLMTADADGDPDLAVRFMQEARAATRVEHPNIVQVLDMGRDPHDSTLYIVEEFLTGSDLRQVLDERRVLPPRAALEIMVPVIAALGAAHQHGIIHRDIKPGNIFLARSPSGEITPKLIDFGISKVAQAGGTDLTKAGTTLGTPEYMSPEQANGDRSIDAQTDIWGVGVVLYEMLTGRCPYEHENYHALLVQILYSPVQRFEAVNASVPSGLAEVVYRALERDRMLRYRTAAELLRALLRCPEFANEAWQKSLSQAFLNSGAEPPHAEDSVGHVVSADRTTRVALDHEPPTEPRVVHAKPPVPVEYGGEFDGAVGEEVPPVRRASPAALTEIRRPVARTRRVWLEFAGTCFLGCVAVAAVLIAVRLNSTPVRPLHNAMAQPTALSTTLLFVNVTTVPADATVQMDGVVVGRGQFTQRIVSNGTSHTLVVSADGFVPQSFEFRDRPPPALVQLVAIPPPPPPPPPPAPVVPAPDEEMFFEPEPPPPSASADHGHRRHHRARDTRRGRRR